MLDGIANGSVTSLAEDVGIAGLLGLSGAEEADPVAESSFDEGTLVIEADNIEWDLTTRPECRRVVVEALTERNAEELLVESGSMEYLYDDRTLDLFLAAGRFRKLAQSEEPRLAEKVADDPLAVGTELITRTGRASELGVESDLLSAVAGLDGYDDLRPPKSGLSIAGYYTDPIITDGASLREKRTLPTDSTVRIYDRPDNIPLYAIDLVDLSLSREERQLLTDGYAAIAFGDVKGDRSPSEAIDTITEDPANPVLSTILRKHTQGYGVLEDFFSDPDITDVYATAPVESNPLRVSMDGESMATNVYYSQTGAGALASRIRRTSGRAFSRASPTVDATADLHNGNGLRIAGVTEPASDGLAFAFREKSDDRFTLPALVKNGTMSAETAAFLSIAVERNAAALVAGTRGAGKTTLLGTLLYELMAGTRTVVIEDTPELPVTPLQEVGRDVQGLHTGDEGLEISAADALRTALRLGDGALVVGEIRGEEARVLYEAMRVGANANAVLGTIHGNGADEIYERVVSDLNVPPSSFGATDLVVTMQAYETPDGRKRRLSAIEGVITGDDDIRFEPLYTYDGETASPTGRVMRGESHFVNKIAGPNESYSDILTAVEERSEHLATLASDGRTSPGEVVHAYVQKRT